MKTRSLVSGILFGSILTASAQAYVLDRSGSNCGYQVNEGGKWRRIDASQVPDETFTETKASRTQADVSVARIGGKWYAFKTSCMKNETGNGAEAAAPPAADTMDRDWFVEASLLYGLPSGDAAKGGTRDTGSSVVVLPDASGKIGYGLRFGWHLNPQSSLSLVYEHLATSQDGTVTRSGQTGTITDSLSFNQIGVLYRYEFKDNASMHSFFDFGGGFAMASESGTAAGYTAGLAPLNGVANYTYSPLWLGANVGAIFKLGGTVSVAPFLGYNLLMKSTGTVQDSTTAAAVAGASATLSAVNFIRLGVSLHF